MPSVPLPENASLEHLKKQAKLVQHLVRSGEQSALDMVREFHPRIDDVSPGTLSAFKRSDAQIVVARLYGFRSWTRLRAHLQLLDEFARPDPADRDPVEAADRFVSLACVSYGVDDVTARLDAGRRMLEADPGLAEATTAAMATTGHRQALAAEIEADPGLVDRACGPNDWPPLLYCAYSRIDSPDPERSTLDTAQLLLDAGADPNAGFLWRGLVPPFTALTGALGHGEQDQPPHPDAFALARLLLEAGADPNDGQALYNDGLAGTGRDDPRHLELLVRFGLGTDTGGPWYRRFGSRLTSPEELLYDELEVAAHRGLPNRMRFLASLELDLDRAVGRSGQTPAHLAQRKGHDEVLAVLSEAGVASMHDSDEPG